MEPGAPRPTAGPQPCPPTKPRSVHNQKITTGSQASSEQPHLPGIEARVHAALGDAAACENLIARADDLYGRGAAADDVPAWLAYFDEFDFNGEVGACYLDLAQPRRADTYFSNTLRLAPAVRVRDRAAYVIYRACAQTQLGNADQAAALIADAVPLIHEAPSEWNVRRIVRARERLPFAKSDPRGQDLDEQLAALVV